MRLNGLALATIFALAPRTGAAQQPPDPRTVKTDFALDGAVIGLAVAGGLLFSLVPVNIERRLDAEVFGFDHGLRGQFSASAAAASNTLIFANVMLPIAIHASFGVDNELARVMTVYTEAVALSYFLNAAAKHLVQRPRPYIYSDDPFVQVYAQRQGIDTHLSFYSGHASAAFTAAAAGSYLYALRSKDEAARALIWGLNVAMASATSNLRVRAGKHFYSDVVLGGIIGTCIGLLVPLVHRSDNVEPYRPTLGEVLSMSGGFVLGVLISELAPIEKDVVLPLEVVPTASEGKTTVELRLDVLRLIGP